MAETTQSAAAERTQDELRFEILEHIGVLRSNSSGWTRELNLVSWNDRPAKFDIRDWTPDHEKMTKGITLTDYEMSKICEWFTGREASKLSAKAVSEGN